MENPVSFLLNVYSPSFLKKPIVLGAAMWSVKNTHFSTHPYRHGHQVPNSGAPFFALFFSIVPFKLYNISVFYSISPRVARLSQCPSTQSSARHAKPRKATQSHAQWQVLREEMSGIQQNVLTWFLGKLFKECAWCRLSFNLPFVLFLLPT